MARMMRLRLLAAVLGCLAVLAGDLMTVAAAMPAGAPAAERSMAGAPCMHCDDCDSVPCPAPTATCVQISPNATPMLATAFDLPAIGFGQVRWLLRTTLLSGLSPPPDPFPPRA
jgi:hypothetical protein